MRESDNLLYLVLENLPALVAILNTDLRYEFANRLHFTWFGTDAENLKGKYVLDIIGESAFDLLEPHYLEALSGEESSFMGYVPFTSGGKRYIHGTAIPLPANGDGTDGILALATDITDYKLMEQALDATTMRSQTVLDTAVDGIITIDQHGIIRSCNKSSQIQFGYGEKELIGRNVSMLMPSPHAENHDSYIQRYIETGEKRIIGIGREVTGKRKDGSEFPMELAVGEFIENGRHFFTGFTRDITARKKAEYEARSRLNELAHISRLNTNHHLATNIAHEVNQPLTAIVTMAQAMLRNLRSGRDNPEVLESALEKIARQGSRASNIINNIRQYYGKGDSGKPSPNNIDDIISDVLLLLEHEILHNNVKVVTRLETGDTMINVNRVQLEQVVLNLVQNAIEAMVSNKGDNILEIKTFGPDDNDPYVRFLIEDNGVGLQDEMAEKIFDSFYTTKKDGMGQGLAICRSIIEAHGGTIRHSSTEGSGTVFSVTLPVKPKEFME